MVRNDVVLRDDDGERGAIVTITSLGNDELAAEARAVLAEEFDVSDNDLLEVDA